MTKTKYYYSSLYNYCFNMINIVFMIEGHSPLYSDDADVAQWDRGQHHSHWRLCYLHADGIQSGNIFLQKS